MEGLLNGIKKTRIVEIICYALSIVPTVFYVAIMINSFDFTGLQEEKTLDLSLIYLNPISIGQMYFLGMSGLLSIATSQYLELLKSIDIKSESEVTFKVFFIASFIVQQFLLFVFIQSDFLNQTLITVQSASLVGSIFSYFFIIKKHINKGIA